MHSKDGVRIVYARPSSFQIQNGGCVIRVYCMEIKGSCFWAHVLNESYCVCPFSEFKGLALGFLDQCFRTNEDLTQQLLTYNVKNWGEQTCLSLAVSIEHEKFLAHVSCQTLLTDIWMGAIKSGRGSTIKVSMQCNVPFVRFPQPRFQA